MSVLRSLARLWRDRRGATALEFAFVAPLLIGFTGAIFEVIFIAYDFSLASEATRRGVRTALLQAPIASVAGVGSTPVVCGNTGTLACTGASVTSSGSFTAVVTSMRDIKPDIQAANTQVTYSASGLDNAVTGPGIVTPLVTVRLIGMTYTFRLLGLFPGAPTSFAFPPFTASAVAPSQVSLLRRDPVYLTG